MEVTNKYIESMREIYNLVNTGSTYKEISKQLNLSKDTIAHRLMKYKRDYLLREVKNGKTEELTKNKV